MVGSTRITRRRFLCRQMPFEDILSSLIMRVDIRTGCQRPGKFTPDGFRDLRYAGIIHGG